MENGIVETRSENVKRTSFLDLPVELRLVIYPEIFRVKSWEAHLARTRDFSAPKRRLSDQCPTCQFISRDRGYQNYLYPTCKLAIDDGELLIYRPCYTPVPHETRNRAAILRVSRSILAEALPYLYANTPFMVTLGDGYRLGIPLRKIGYPSGLLPSRAFDSRIELPISQLQDFYVRVDLKGDEDALAAQISELMGAIWRHREQTKIQLQCRYRHSNWFEELTLSTLESTLSEPRIRTAFFGEGRHMEKHLWHTFVLQNALPHSLLDSMYSFVKPEDFHDGTFEVTVLMPAIEEAYEALEL